MRLPFFDPRRGEVAAVATDLITRFGLRAREEAAYLAELAAQMRSRRHKVLYELVTHEIDASFAGDYQEFRVWPERLNLFMPLPG